MNILFLSQIVPYPPHGGVLQRGYNILKELSKNHSILLLAFVHPDILTDKAKIDESKKELSKICSFIDYFPVWPKKNILFKFIALLWGLVSINPFGVLAYKSRKYQQKIREIIIKENIDIIHFDTISLAQYYDRSLKIPCFLTHHNIESNLMDRRTQVESNVIKKIYLWLQTVKIKNYEKSKSSLFNINITVSDKDAKQLNELVEDINTVVIPNGVDIQYFQMQRDPDNPVVIYTGGMNMYANSDAVMFFVQKIFPLIKKEIPDFRFFAIGQDPPQQLLTISKTEPDILVPGYVDDIRPYVAKASVYIVPIRVGGGTRLKVLDAMAMGKAIVSTTIGSEGIEVTPDQNIVIADDPKNFANKTIQLLKNPELRNNLGKEARQLVESKYSWPSIVRKLDDSYQRSVN